LPEVKRDPTRNAPTPQTQAGQPEQGSTELQEAAASRELSPEHLAFIEFLVERALEEWERSKAK
jgi:hypothetical protein